MILTVKSEDINILLKLPCLHLLNVKQAKSSTVETSLDLSRKSSDIFGRFRKNDRKRSYNLRTVFEEFSKISGSLREKSCLSRIRY